MWSQKGFEKLMAYKGWTPIVDYIEMQLRPGGKMYYILTFKEHRGQQARYSKESYRRLMEVNDGLATR